MRRTVAREQGMALMGILVTVLVLTLVGGLVLHLVGKEVALSAARLYGLQSLHVAEGGAFAARAALMVLMGISPAGRVTVDPSLTGTLLSTWYAGGDRARQNSFALLDYLVLDGARYSLGATSATDSVTFQVNWALPGPHRKLEVAGTPPANPLAAGRYTATLTLARRAAAHPSCAPDPACYIHWLGPDEYEYLYTYTVTSDGVVPPRARRRVVLAQDFSVVVRRQTFAQFALFTHVHTTPGGSPIWFTSRTSFDGPVHTNGEYRFAFFPKFSDRLTSVSAWAWFNNRGSAVRQQANEHVVGGVRRDAPVTFDATPADITDDADNPPANFTRGVAVIPMPTNPYSQKGVAVGRDPADTSPVTNLQVRQAVPELADTSASVPNGIYVPVVDQNGNGRSDPGELLAGGIYVQGDLTSLTLAPGGPGNDRAVYTFTAGGQTVTVTVDRAAQTTTVTNSAWPAPQTRTFAGVPRGWQGGPGNTNGTIIYVEGTIQALAGTLEEHEQTTIVAAGRIDIADHLRYEDPPDPADPADTPLNVLGLYSASSDIRVTTAAPDDLVLHGVFMAGNPADGYSSSVHVQNYNAGSPRGTVHLIGGIIEEYYGAFGTFDPVTGNPVTGYGRDFRFDRRMLRGFAPPYFPTTGRFEIGEGSERLANVRPAWREAAP